MTMTTTTPPQAPVYVSTSSSDDDKDGPWEELYLHDTLFIPLRCRGQCYKYLYQRSTLFCISVSLKEQQGFCQRQLALRRVSAHRKIVGTRHPVHKYKQLVFTVYSRCLLYKLHNIRCPPLPAWPTTVLLLFDCLHLFASIVPMCRHSMPGWDRFRLVTPDTEASGGSFRRSLSRFLW